MNLYVLTFCQQAYGNDETKVLGVFSSIELAKSKVSNVTKWQDEGEIYVFTSPTELYEITPVVLDAEPVLNE